MDKKLICITGMDGTGKSTVIKAVTSHFQSIYVANIWDLIQQPIKGLPFKSKKEIDDFLGALTPDSRLLFLSHAMKYSIDKALESNNNLVLIDSYYYKYFASEKALGANIELIKSLIALFPEPDLVIELQLPVNKAAQRKKHFSHYECGLSEFCNIDSFLSFQTKVKNEWNLFRRNKWNVINAQKAENEVLEQVLAIIKSKLTK